jgi:hypothetical protein
MTDGHFIVGRLQCNRHFAAHLRRRPAQRHEKGTALRETLDSLSHAELVEVYFRNDVQGRAHAARRQAEKEAME